MNKKLKEISGFFKIEKLKNDKRIVVFLICLLIATVLWFLNALSKDYSTTISYPVKYVSAPKNQFLANKPPEKLDLKVDAHGFTLLRYKLSLSFSPIILNLTSLTKNLNPDSRGYLVNTNNLIGSVSDQVSNEISINNIEPAVIQIKFDSLVTKLIPIKPNYELSFKPQFNLKEPVSITPEQAKITGPTSILDTIYFLRTEKKLFGMLDSDKETSIEILHPKNTTISPKKFTINISVERFTEKELKVPIETQNIPENVNIKLFPSEIKLTLLVGLSQFENISSKDFEVFVDYKSVSSTNEDLNVNIGAHPSFVQIQRFSPEKVEYLIETN